MATLEAIQARIAKLQAQAETLVVTKSTAVLEKIRDLMQKHGITVADIGANSGKRRGRKPGATVEKKSAAVAKYADPKTGATWSGHGRAPGWIVNAKDRSKFAIAGASTGSTTAAKTPAKKSGQPRGPQPALYRDPKSGATWSGRGPAPTWLAGAKDRTKFLIANAAEGAATPKADAGKAAPEKKAPVKKAAAKKTVVAAKKATSKKVVAKKPAATPKTAVAPAKKAGAKKSAAAKAPVARKTRVTKLKVNDASAQIATPQPGADAASLATAV